MNIDLLKSRFTPEMLEAVKLEVDNFVQDKFTQDDYSINKHLIDTFFVQPVFYATLLNYYTMYEQRSSLSLSDIYGDDAISPTKKDAYFLSFAADIGIDITGLDSDGIVSAIENRLTVSDTRIHSDMMRIVLQYEEAIDGATGVFWTMFRNSPDHMYFSSGRFSAAVMYENLSSTVEISDIMSQSITMDDIEKYKNISNAGRVTNFIDIYVKPSVRVTQLSSVVADGETETLVFPAAKYKKFVIAESARPNVKCTSMDGGYIGFASRSVSFEVTGPASVTITAEKYDDDPAVEDTLRSNNPTYDIEFFGLVPVDLNIKLQNSNAVSKVISYMGSNMSGGEWSSKINELAGILRKSGNSIVGIDATLWVNPLIKKTIAVYDKSLAISPKSIMSWVDIDNTCIKAESIEVLETGNVTFL